MTSLIQTLTSTATKGAKTSANFMTDRFSSPDYMPGQSTPGKREKGSTGSVLILHKRLKENLTNLDSVFVSNSKQ